MNVHERARAVIFDLDGVIVDTEPWWHEVRATYAAARGRTWTEADSRACAGRSTREWSQVMRERLALDEAAERVGEAVVNAMLERYRVEPSPEVPGAVASVRRIARRVPAGLASGTHPAIIAAALGATGLAGVFAAVVSADDVAHGKPAPDVYLEAARRLAVPPAACLVVEDSGNGVRAGKAAGMRVVLVPNDHTPPDAATVADADAVLASLADLDPLRPPA